MAKKLVLLLFIAAKIVSEINRLISHLSPEEHFDTHELKKPVLWGKEKVISEWPKILVVRLGLYISKEQEFLGVRLEDSKHMCLKEGGKEDRCQAKNMHEKA